jgi:hypothetical protein
MVPELVEGHAALRQAQCAFGARALQPHQAAVSLPHRPPLRRRSRRTVRGLPPSWRGDAARLPMANRVLRCTPPAIVRDRPEGPSPRGSAAGLQRRDDEGLWLRWALRLSTNHDAICVRTAGGGPVITGIPRDPVRRRPGHSFRLTSAARMLPRHDIDRSDD